MEEETGMNQPMARLPASAVCTLETRGGFRGGGETDRPESRHDVRSSQLIRRRILEFVGMTAIATAVALAGCASHPVAEYVAPHGESLRAVQSSAVTKIPIWGVHGRAQDSSRTEATVEEPGAQDPQRQQRDHVTLQNGDVLRGKLMDLRDGNLTFNTDDLGDLEIPLSRVADLSTAEPIVVVTGQRTHVEGRIHRIVGDQLQMVMEEGNFTTIPLADWNAMRFPGGSDARWRGSLSLGGRVSTGNTEERRLNFAVNFRRRTDGDPFKGPSD